MSDPSSPPPTPITSNQRQFPCKQCGADLVFAPGTNHLKCPYCGAENDIPGAPESAGGAAAAIQEEDFRATLDNLAGGAEVQDAMTVKCVGCGAESQFNADIVANKCP